MSRRVPVTGAASGIGASAWMNGHALVADGGISGAVLTGMIPPPQI